MNRSFAAIVLTLVFVTPARADLVIRGAEVEALKCATVFVSTAVLMNQFKVGTPAETAMIAAIGEMFLDRVPGTAAQKQQAMKQMFDRMTAGRDPKAALEEFKRALPRCEALVGK